MLGPALQGKRGGHYRLGPRGQKIYQRVRSYPPGLVAEAARGAGLRGGQHEQHFALLASQVRAAHPGHHPGEHARLAAFHDRRYQQHKRAGNHELASAHAKLSLIHQDLAGRDPILTQLRKAGL